MKPALWIRPLGEEKGVRQREREGEKEKERERRRGRETERRRKRERERWNTSNAASDLKSDNGRP